MSELLAATVNDYIVLLVISRTRYLYSVVVLPYTPDLCLPALPDLGVWPRCLRQCLPSLSALAACSMFPTLVAYPRCLALWHRPCVLDGIGV